jgi:hypothetical protein
MNNKTYIRTNNGQAETKSIPRPGQISNLCLPRFVAIVYKLQSLETRPIRIVNQSKCESVMSTICRMFILNKVTLRYDALMILEGYWRAFISLAAREISLASTVSRSEELQPVHAACVEVEHIFMIRVHA